MPRKSNQTQYDDMMSVFKQRPMSGETQRRSRDVMNTPSAVVDPLTSTRRSDIPRPPSASATTSAPASVFTAPTQPSSYGCGSPAYWDEPYTTPSSTAYAPISPLSPSVHYYTNQSFDVQTLSADTLPLAGSSRTLGTSRWMIMIASVNGQKARQWLSADKFQLPVTQCACGTHFRFLHLLTMAGVSQPSVGVLFNFRNEGQNVWIEGTAQGQRPTMPLPWEATIPFVLLTTMFAAAGTLLNVSQRAQNQGKPPRYNIDDWDEMMMERDKRLTGHRRGQRTDPVAPEGFATSSTWYTEKTQ
ncbi:hypothetical protein EW145_g2451 [Phellinidium pouzarii]|uniref:NADH dehydrogenase [ubiquinone] 1 alpha subcomplex subunit 1 n=1 Tax=Phellinidium pouzarii TaxID=167371 RepID=A0A4S4LB87_9AGAM|nr:hypothetical protein EW145_g2451 [Phellinidium pouzarii]